jgi:hypothetical protein
MRAPLAPAQRRDRGRVVLAFAERLGKKRVDGKERIRC